jgi:hypothetical protein
MALIIGGMGKLTRSTNRASTSHLRATHPLQELQRMALLEMGHQLRGTVM